MWMTLGTLHQAIWLFWLSQSSPTAVWQKNGLVNQWKQTACTSLVSRLGGTMTLGVNHLLPLTNEEPSHCQLMSVIGLSSVKPSDLRFAFGSWRWLLVCSWRTSINPKGSLVQTRTRWIFCRMGTSREQMSLLKKGGLKQWVVLHITDPPSQL